MTDIEKIKHQFSYLGKDLLDVFFKEGKILNINKNTEILHEGQYVKVIPLVIEGLIKVFSIYEDKELLRQRIVAILYSTGRKLYYVFLGKFKK